LNYFILHKSFGKNDNFITCYIAIGALAIIANFANNYNSKKKLNYGLRRQKIFRVMNCSNNQNVNYVVFMYQEITGRRNNNHDLGSF